MGSDDGQIAITHTPQVHFAVLPPHAKSTQAIATVFSSIRAWAVLSFADGDEVIAIATFAASYAVNSLPTAQIRVAVGQAVTTAGLQKSVIHTRAAELEQRLPIKVYGRFRGDVAENTAWADEDVLLFDGYVGSVSFNRAAGALTVDMRWTAGCRIWQFPRSLVMQRTWLTRRISRGPSLRNRRLVPACAWIGHAAWYSRTRTRTWARRSVTPSAPWRPRTGLTWSHSTRRRRQGRPSPTTLPYGKTSWRCWR